MHSVSALNHPFHSFEKSYCWSVFCIYDPFDISQDKRTTFEPSFKMIHQLFHLLLLVASVNSHSWIEQLTVIAPNGTFVGEPGYARGNVLRTAPGFSDPTMVNLIPPNTQANVSVVLPSSKMCKDTQQSYNQTKESPRLQASAGAAIALRYQENGHVTLPQNQPGKPKNRGSIYVYGTTEPKEDETLLNVHGKWTQDGTGGDGSGVLLSKQNFDDSRCYQVNSGEISTTRQQKYPHQANQLMGADLWCQQDIKLPSNLPSGKPYTLYWVWDWPTLPGGDPSYPNGKQEIYTTCMDIDVTGSSNTESHANAKYITGQDLNSASIPTEFDGLTSGKDVVQPDSSASSASSSPSVASSAPSASSASSAPSQASTVAPAGPDASAQTVTVTMSNPPASTVTVTETAAATVSWKTKTEVLYVCPQTATAA